MIEKERAVVARGTFIVSFLLKTLSPWPVIVSLVFFQLLINILTPSSLPVALLIAVTFSSLSLWMILRAILLNDDLEKRLLDLSGEKLQFYIVLSLSMAIILPVILVGLLYEVVGSKSYTYLAPSLLTVVVISGLVCFSNHVNSFKSIALLLPLLSPFIIGFLSVTDNGSSDTYTIYYPIALILIFLGCINLQRFNYDY